MIAITIGSIFKITFDTLKAISTLQARGAQLYSIVSISASDPFNGQNANSISKPPKVIESRT